MVPTDALAGRRVLVVEDDAATRDLLERILELEGYETCAVGGVGAAQEAVARFDPSLALLDLQLADGDGLALLEQLRAERPGVGCIVVSGRDEEASRVLGLRLGADDYVVKPFSSGELLARVESVLRRTRRTVEGHVLRRGDLFIDLASHEVRRAGRPIPLTAKEYDLLHFLASSPRQVFTRAQLLHHVWSSNAAWQDDATVTEHIRRLRLKLGDGGSGLIETIRGVGYRFAGT